MAESAPPSAPPTPEPSTPAPHFHEIGISGLKRVGGLLQEEFNPKLTGQRWIKTATEMRDNEPVLGGAYLMMEMLLRQASIEIKPKKDDARPEAHRIAKRMNDALHDMEHTWSTVLSEFLSAIVYGWHTSEPVYKICRGPDSPVKEFRSKYDDGFIGWRKIATRSQDSLAADPWIFKQGTNELCGLRQQAPPDYRTREIPIDKLLLFHVVANKDSPEGRSLFRRAYVPWYFAKRIREIEAIGVERDLAGLLDIQIPPACFSPTATAEQRATRAHFETWGPRVRRGEYECLIRPSETDEKNNPTGYKVGLINSGGRRPTDVDPIVRRYESRMLVALLWEVLLLGTDQHGSYALSSDKTDKSVLALGAILDAFCELFNRCELQRLCSYNGIPLDLCPEMTHGDLEKVDAVQWMTFVSQGIQSGAIIPGPELDAEAREIGDLPVREDEAATGLIPGDLLNSVIPKPSAIPSALANAPIDPASLGNGYTPKVPDAILETPIG